MERVLGYEELKVLATEPQPEGVIIADAVDELMQGYEENLEKSVDSRQALTAGDAQAKIEACGEVLEIIRDRYGYEPLRRER